MANARRREVKEKGAANLCAVLFKIGDPARRYATPTHELADEMRISLPKAKAASHLAARRGWIRIVGGCAQLTAAGVHVAKELLDLPR